MSKETKMTNGEADGESIPLRDDIMDEKSKEASGKDYEKKDDVTCGIGDETEEEDWENEGQDLEDIRGNFLSRMVIKLQHFVCVCLLRLKYLTSGHLSTTVILLGFVAYFIVALLYKFGDEESKRLVGFTVLAVIIKTRHFVGRSCKQLVVHMYGDDHLSVHHTDQLTKVRFFTRWLCYGGLMAVMAWVVIDVGFENPQNLRSLPGLFCFLLVCLLFSSCPARINWHTIYWSIGLQFLCALLALKFKPGRNSLFWIQDRLNEYFDNTKPASELLFGKSYKDHHLIFGAFPLIFYLNGTLTLLYFVGAMQFVIHVIGSFLSFVLDAQPIEAMSVAGGIFMEGLLAILTLKPYLPSQSKSQLFVVIASTLSSLGGAYLAILNSLGVPLKHIIPAMLISAPATFAVCKLMMPETRPKDSKLNQIEWDSGMKGEYSNALEALQGGAMSVLPLLGNVIAIAFTFLSFIEWINSTFAWFGERVGVKNFTMEYIFSFLFYPVALAMGIDPKECSLTASLLGYRLISSNIVAFFKVREMRDNRLVFEKYMVDTNFTGPITYFGDMVQLDLWNVTLKPGVISERTEAVVTYSLCGFSSFLSVSIILGTFYTLLPQRRQWLMKMVIPALIAGNISNCMTGCFASLFF